MPLESLLELVETLRARIDQHGAALSQSEALTRATLIDPLLRELGWDTEDPALVIPEYSQPLVGRADYALKNQGKAVVMVEAKPLNTSLQGAALQCVNYCNSAGIPFFAITNGNSWEIYETFLPVALQEKQIVAFSLGDMKPAEVCLRALALWRPSVSGGNVSVGQSPIIQIDHQEQPPITPDPPTFDPPPDVPNTDWTQLSEFRPESGEPSTVEILFPDGSTIQLAQWQWYRVTTETVRWLYESGKFGVHNCRVQRGSRYVVSDSATHPNGKDFTAQKEVGPFHIETNYSSAYLVRNAQLVIEHAGLDPSRFHMRFLP